MMCSHASLLLTFLSSAASLSGVSLCSDSDPYQHFQYDAASLHISLKSDPTQCLQVGTGCCDGELIRGGSYLELQKCAANYESQKLSWPSASNNFTIRPLSDAGEPAVSVLANGAPLVFDARGYLFPGVQLIGAAFDPVLSTFSADAASGRLVSTATNLCVTADLTQTAQAGQQLNLQLCAPNKQIPGGGTPSTQLFTLNGSTIVTSEGLCATAERPMGVDVRGGARLISASCSGSSFPSQAFNLSASGHITAISLPGTPTADAGRANWWGARVPLSAAPPSSTGIFSFRVVNGTSSLGVLTHLESGLCLDSAGVPEGQGCLDEGVREFPFCDPTQSLESRLNDLLGRLSVSEATGFTGDDGENSSPCGTHTAAVPRLDITQMRWLVEVSSMASSLDSCEGLQPWHGGCPTSFPAAMLLTGAFNSSLWREHGRVVGDEMRAINNLMTTASPFSSSRVSLAGHGPDLNNPRDPRNGRNGELSAEDPFLTGAFSAQYVRGMQFGATLTPAVNGTTRRMLASLKHYTAYSRETDRMGSEGNVSLFDLWDTYLPQYEEPMVDSSAAGTMCSYFSMRIEGTPGDPVYVPSCANSYILTQVIREYWNRPDATHLSDCGAVVNMFWPTPRGNGYTNGSFVAAAAAALNAGMDQNSNTISPSHLWLALEQGLTTQNAIYAAAGRVLAQRFRLGHFDPLETIDPQLLKFGADDIGTAANREAAAEGVRQGTVLLKNGGGAVAPPLPLLVGSKILVVGPTAASVTAAIGDIYGASGAVCPDGSNDCWPLVGEAIAIENVGGNTTILPGITILANDTQNWGPAIAAASSGEFDAIILCLGTDRSVAGEGTDRNDIGLPGVQEEFSLAVLAMSKNVPVLLLLVHNLPVSFDALLAAPVPPAAIVDVWAPTTNSGALAELLFGKVNKWGRATLTVYPRAYENTTSIYDMSNSPSATNAGRSYRYVSSAVDPNTPRPPHIPAHPAVYQVIGDHTSDLPPPLHTV